MLLRPRRPVPSTGARPRPFPSRAAGRDRRRRRRGHGRSHGRRRPLLITDDECPGRRRAPARRRRRGRPRRASAARPRAPARWTAPPRCWWAPTRRRRPCVLVPPRRGHVHVLSLGDAPPTPVPRTPWTWVPARSSSCPAPSRWLVELLADVGDGGGRPAVDRRGGRRLRRCGASVAAALAVRASGRGESASTARRERVVLVDLDPLGPGLARLLGSRTSAGSPGRTSPSPAAGSARARCATHCPAGSDGSACSAGGRGRRRPPSLPRPRSCARSSSAAQRGHDWVVLDVPRSTRRRSSRRCSPAATTGWSSARAASRAVAAGARVVATAARRRRRRPPRGGGASRAVPPPPATSPGRSGCRWSRPCRDQRRLDEHLDLGLGPRPPPRHPLARAAATVLVDLGAASSGRGADERRRRGPGGRRRAAPWPSSSRRCASSWPAAGDPLTPAVVAGAAPRGRPGGRRDGAGGPRRAAARRARGRSARAPAPARTASPTSWSTGRTRSTSTAARASSARRCGFADDAAVRRLAQRLAGAAGRRLDDASPYVDLRLADGTRFHAVLAPLARPGHGDLAARPAAGGPSRWTSS